MKLKPLFAVTATLLCASAFVVAQQPGAPSGPTPSSTPGVPPPNHPQNHGHMHPSTRSRDQRQERHDEMQDLDGLGMPMGDFWQNPRLVQSLNLTTDQVKRLSEINLQGRLKLIQLDANLEMEQAKLDALLDLPNVDASSALSQTDRIADARANVEKADAHLAFDLRAALTQDQLTKMRDSRMHDRMPDSQRVPRRSQPGRNNNQSAPQPQGH